MRIKILGAAGGEVTGSAYWVQSGKSNIMVDVGMFQGGRASEGKNKLPPGVPIKKLDAILLTHGHIDHSGRIPLLVKFGFNKPIYATRQTHELTEILLEDSARLQLSDAIRQNRKFWKKGQPPVEPLYTTGHVEFMKELNRPVKLNQPVEVAPGITARWIESGHMLGSGSIELTVTENGKKKVIAFSGDLGPITYPLLPVFDHFSKADLVFMECTYGDRDHQGYEQTLNEFNSIVDEVAATKGKVLVPCFAIGRAQQIIYHMAEYFHKTGAKQFPVYLDSPMALRAFEVYRNNQGSLDQEYQELKRKGVFPLNPSFFIPSPSGETSKALNEVKGPCMILAGSGMCNGGRILHHLFHNIDKPGIHVMIVGYQSYGSVGRQLVEKATKVRIFGEEKVVRAKVHTLGGFSAHAGQTDLLKWLSYVTPSKPKIVLTHGEVGPRKALADCIKKNFKINSVLPKFGDTIEL